MKRLKQLKRERDLLEKMTKERLEKGASLADKELLTQSKLVDGLLDKIENKKSPGVLGQAGRLSLHPIRERLV